MSPTEVLVRKLYLGSLEDVQNLSQLQSLGIVATFNMALTECTYDWLNSEHGLAIHKYDLKDNYTCDISSHFDSVADLIEEYLSKDSIVFIHCYQGKSRSVAFVLAYLMKYNNLSLRESFNYLSSIRDIQPNIKFMQYLMEYEQQIHSINKSTFDLHEYKIRYINELLELKDVEKVREVYNECGQDYELTLDKLLI